MKSHRLSLYALVIALAISAVSGVVRAQAEPVIPPPPPIVEHAQAVAAPPAEFYRETLFVLSAGATLNTGNTRSFAANVGSRFTLKRDRHQLTLEGQFIYGLAALRDEGDVDGDGNINEFNDYDLNSRQLSGLARYDFFMTTDDALFASVGPRWDTFAGLDFRIQNQVGYMRNFFSVLDKHRGWGEIGYDLTYDNWTNGDDQTNHSVRAFLGYDNHINEMVTFLTGLEGLFNVERSDDVRVNWNAELTSKLVDAFQAGVRFTLRYDNEPVPGAEKLDTITTMNLLYAMDFEAKPAEEAEVDCDAQTAKAVSDAVARCRAVESVTAPEAPAPAVEDPAPQGDVPAEPPATDVPAADTAP
jgi:hypothetical protein